MQIKQAITTLRLIFVGVLLNIFDFSYFHVTESRGEVWGYKFDFLNDFVGMLLITYGVKQLGKFQVNSTYRTLMGLTLVCCICNCVDAFTDHFVFRTPKAVVICWIVLSIASLVATLMFSAAMQLLSSHYSLHGAAKSWSGTGLMIAIIWVAPIGLFNLIGLGNYLAGRDLHWDIGGLIFPLMLVLVLPLIPFFISIYRMQKEAADVQIEFVD